MSALDCLLDEIDREFSEEARMERLIRRAMAGCLRDWGVPLDDPLACRLALVNGGFLAVEVEKHVNDAIARARETWRVE